VNICCCSWKISDFEPNIISAKRDIVCTYSWRINGFVTKLTRRVPLVEQELLTLPEHLRSPPVFSGVRVTRFLFVFECLSAILFVSGSTFVVRIVLLLLRKLWSRTQSKLAFQFLLQDRNIRSYIILLPYDWWLIIYSYNVCCWTWLGWPLSNICVTNNHGYVSIVVNTSRSFTYSWRITGLVTRFTRKVPLVEQELLTLYDVANPVPPSGQAHSPILHINTVRLMIEYR
jgi:hypothetical protein